MKTIHVAIRLLMLSLFCVSSGFQFSKIDNGFSLIKSLCAEAKKIQSLSFQLEKRERIDGVMMEQVNQVKYNRKPLKVYMKQDAPNKGMEVLFVEATNQNKLTINPNGFPWVTLNLDAYNSKVRHNQHHTIYESGFDYVVDMVEDLLLKHKDLEQQIKVDGTIVWDNRECHKIVMNNPHFRYIDYTVKKGEDLNTIGKARSISEYMLLEKNPTIKDYDGVKAGQVIKIPTDYALKLIFYLDKKTLLPLVIKVYDDMGLFEEYKYSKLVLNPKFDTQVFTKTNQEYKF